MAPSAVESEPVTQTTINTKARAYSTLTGALSDVESFDVTPSIGREFPKANLVEWLEAPNSDELLRDLAVTSKFTPGTSDSNGVKLIIQSPSEASYSFAPKMGSRTSFRRS